MTAGTDKRRPFCGPSWLSFIKQNPYLKWNESLMEAIHIMKFGRNPIKNDQVRVTMDGQTDGQAETKDHSQQGPNNKIVFKHTYFT